MTAPSPLASLEQAMIESPVGGIYEAQPQAAEPGESVIFKTMNSVTGELGPGGIFGASVVEVLKPEFLLSHLKRDLRVISIKFLD